MNVVKNIMLVVALIAYFGSILNMVMYWIYEDDKFNQNSFKLFVVGSLLSIQSNQIN